MELIESCLSTDVGDKKYYLYDIIFTWHFIESEEVQTKIFLVLYIFIIIFKIFSYIVFFFQLFSNISKYTVCIYNSFNLHRNFKF